ncbi:MAG: HAMP domain-containing histidine kinase [Ignavibacteriales bacterium]|nr:MAG: HAMP domain-containing histidine kinase [Ignavibacteriales bacterium]
MRVIKQNNLRFESFQKSLPVVDRNGDPVKKLKLVVNGTENNIVQESVVENRFVSIFNRYSAKVSVLNDEQEIAELFSSVIKQIIPASQAEIFLLNKSQSQFEAVRNNCDQSLLRFINSAYKEGIIDWIFETGKPKIIPELSSYKLNERKYNYILLPISEGVENKGILLILTSLQNLGEEGKDYQLVRIVINSTLTKLELLKARSELVSTYREMQVYQSKLSNDFKLSAIGELTSGIVEDILSPLQVIMSNADYLSKGINDEDAGIVDNIKSQVKKVENVISRLVKFADVGDEQIKIYPCSVNELINDYYSVVQSSLRAKNVECILDFEKNIPPVLTHPDYISQLLTNVFSLIGSTKSDEGGILLQTKYQQEKIHIRIITTVFIKELNKAEQSVEMQIISNLMKKHEGNVDASSDLSKGSTIILSFPLKRKLRK